MLRALNFSSKYLVFELEASQFIIYFIVPGENTFQYHITVNLRPSLKSHLNVRLATVPLPCISAAQIQAPVANKYSFTHPKNR